MLIKEYRIPLPLTVDEYRIAQLYMIAKKSREETKGAGSGVEILINEPYEQGPGGNGQYTKKIYHVGSHLPGWFKSLLPKSALTVEEEAWNAYPYTKTRYTCPFVQRFSLEIETCYCPDEGHQENVFELKGSDLKERGVDIIDVVKDQLHGTDYLMEEDPRIYASEKTGRGPLNESWVQDYWAECKNKPMPNKDGKAIMCAYKLCRVEFHYWGMQSKIEKFIHDVALRKTMLRAHRQAWAWQDEWHGLTMDDIREIEKQTAEALKKKMAASEDDDELDGESDNEDNDKKEEDNLFGKSTFQSSNVNDISLSPSASTNSFAGTATSASQSQKVESKEIRISDTLVEKPIKVQISDLSVEETPAVRRCSRKNSSAAHGSPRHSKNFEMLSSWRMESIVRKDSDVEDNSEDEFFDCLGTEKDDDVLSLTKWSSVERLPQDTDSANEESKDDSIFNEKYLEKVTVGRQNSQKSLITRGISESRGSYDPGNCKTSTLCLIVHAGCALDAAMDLTSKKSDVTTFKGAFESVIRQHYSSMIGHVAIKLVPCPSICTDALGILSSLSPYSFDRFTSGESPSILHESVSIGAIPLISASQPEYADAVIKTVISANQVYQDFLKSEDGQGFTGQIVVIGDSMGSLLAYDALTRHSHSGQYANEDDIPPSPVHGGDGEHLQVTYDPLTSSRRRSSSSTSESGANSKLDFDVTDFFMFGSPLSLVLAHRKIHSEDRQMHLTRPCHQVYNLFHPTDPLAARLEPILSARFAAIAPSNVAKYSRYPMGDGQSSQLMDCIRFNSHVFSDSNLEPMTPNTTRRRSSDISMQSLMSGLDVLPLQSTNQLQQKWWGNKRLDYALYCPEGLAAFPVHSLPHLFHASYWESTDAIAFILQQIGWQDNETTKIRENTGDRLFIPGQPREKWIKKRTSVKLKNVAPNHRANDVIVGEGNPVTLKARFMYGPLDMVALTGEKVDIYIMKDPPSGDWSLVASEVTDKSGRIAYSIPSEATPSFGIHPIKMIVRGDHSFADLYCAILPPRTECVVFSIDGSFTASMSVTGRDPRVRAGAVDVVRHWHELGYLIIYVTGRPDMQHHKVVAWLAQHNFPHGLVYFEDGLSTEFLGHKTEYLRNLVQDHKISIHAAYGSCKDINVYSTIGIPAEKIFIVGKAQKKQQALASILTEGYSVHLNALQTLGGSRPAKGNALMVIPRGCFGFSGQSCSIQRRRSARRTTSFPTTGMGPRKDINLPTLSFPGLTTKDDIKT